MRRVKRRNIVVLLSIVALLVGGFVQFHRRYDEAMFAPHPRDHDRMAETLAARFGDRVRLLDVPVVNRDVNGIAGLVDTELKLGTYRAGQDLLVFERRKGRTFCLMAYRPWEIDALRRTLASRDD